MGTFATPFRTCTSRSRSITPTPAPKRGSSPGSSGLPMDGSIQTSRSGASRPRTCERILEDLLGVEVLNGQLEMACTGSFPYDANTDIPCDDKMMIGRILLHHGTILRQFSEDYDPKADREATPTGYQRDLKDEERALAASQGLDTIDLSRVRIEHSPEALMRCDLDFLGEDALRA